MAIMTKSSFILFFFLTIACGQPAVNYPWLDKDYSTDYYRISDIPLPEGYERLEYSIDSFQHWLSYLPLKQNDAKVHLFDHMLKSNQDAHYQIIDIDVGDRDLQQCADAIIRLYAEYLYSLGKYDDISFNFTSGDKALFKDWMNGLRPIVTNNQVTWEKQAADDISYKNFRSYLNTVFTYCGSYSLAKEMNEVNNITELQIGDVFLQGGFPGHGVIVVDMAVNLLSAEKIFMIAQSYMPAQEIHILKNPENKSMSPWYKINTFDKLYTPEWTFNWKDLKRF